MKKLILLLLILIILSGCTGNNLKNRTEQEIEACYLIQEFVVFGSPDTDQNDWVDCEFKDVSQYFPNDDRWVAIHPIPSKKHPNYDTYIRNKKYREDQELETPEANLLIDIENQVVVDPNTQGQIKNVVFQKTEDGEELFNRLSDKEATAIYGEDFFSKE